MKYNYVIFGSDNDFLKVAFSDIIRLKGVKYIGNKIDTDNKFLLALFRIHNSIKINSVLPLPFKNAWKKIAFRNAFKNGKPLCFVFFAGNRWCNAKYFIYIKSKYPDCKIVIYCQDVIDKNTNKNIFNALSLCDLKLSYDKGDAEKYGMLLYQDVYSKIDVKPSSGLPDYDVCCIMKAKDRLQKGIELYDRLESLGLKCYFYFSEVKKRDRIIRKNVFYGDKIPYKKNLEIVLKSRAVAEILQKGSRGYTLRAGEAIVYGKKLITDNLSVKDEPFYSPQNVLAYESEERITKEFFEGKANWSPKFTEDLSPKKLLLFIDGKL